jgi:hypothetical protein
MSFRIARWNASKLKKRRKVLHTSFQALHYRLHPTKAVIRGTVVPAPWEKPLKDGILTIQ